MQLTTFADYSFRILIYLACKKAPASLNEISKSYGISRNHVIKAVNVLQKNGFLKTRRGVGGGITLGREPEEINLLDVVSCTEPNFTLVGCLNDETNTCKITGACRLKGILAGALKAFMEELGRYTLADVTGNPKVILKLLDRESIAESKKSKGSE